MPQEFSKGVQHARPEKKDDARKHVHQVILPGDLKPEVTWRDPADLTDVVVAEKGVIGGVVSHQVKLGGPHGPEYTYLILFEDGDYAKYPRDRVLALSKDPLVFGAGKDRPVAPVDKTTLGDGWKSSASTSERCCSPSLFVTMMAGSRSKKATSTAS